MRTGAKVRQRTQRNEPRKRTRRNVPRTLEAALTQDWKISEELTSWVFRGSNRREGFLMLRKKGNSETVLVRCVALYELGKPHFL
jgi:hypothetical protein